MRIALLQPTYWPEVRRGSERMVHDLGVTLAARGHDVTLLTGHRGRESATIEEGMRVERRRRPPEDLPLMRAHELHLLNVANVVRGLRPDFDVAHAFFPVDAWAATRLRRRGGPPVVFTFTGIPLRRYLVARRYRLELMVGAARDAEAVTVLSEAAAARFRGYLGRDPVVLPPGLLADRFATQAARAERPTLVCAASLGDPRKRGGLLGAAFRRLRRRRPEARLLVVRTADPVMSGAVPELPDGAEWVQAEHTEGLAAAYGRAWASVLPAVDEAFGLVLVESLASGTPVVAARSGGCPEIVSRREVGLLFEPDDEADLARAMGEALDLGGRAGIAEACRARAAEYDWSLLVERYEDLYDRARARRGAASSPAVRLPAASRIR